MSASVESTDNGLPMVPRGARVVVVISRGPVETTESELQSVPSVLAQPQGAALGRIEDAGLNAQAFTDYDAVVERGHVIEQFPPAGAAVPRASDVIILVSSGPAQSAELVPLPAVVGLPEEVAIERLREGGLEPESVRVHDANAQPGIAIAQLPSQPGIAAENPAGDSGRRARRIFYVGLAVIAAVLVAIAAFMIVTARTAVVPDVTGLNKAGAKAALVAQGLRQGPITEQAGSNAPEGTVISQSPAGGVDVREGTAVALVIAATVPKSTVPSVVGLSQSDAAAAIGAAGLSVQTAQKYSDSVPQGTVIDQSPAASTQADKGSAVTISVSLGPQSTNVTQPDLVGLSQADATAKATATGLTSRVVNQYSSATSTGLVARTYPAAGQSVAPGTTIGISVSLGAAPTGAITVPDLEGLTSADANTTLASAGLNAAIVQYNGSGQPGGTVVAQLPTPSDQAPNGSTVVVFVSSGK